MIEPPLRLSCILGDCLGSLRAALDYVAWQLAFRYCSRPVVSGKDKIYFPIFKRSGDFINAKTRKQLVSKYSIPGAVMALIESVQPYHAGNEALGLLIDLVNEDKHRLPLFTIAKVRTIRFVEVRKAGRAGGIFSSGQTVASNVRVSFGTDTLNATARLRVLPGQQEFGEFGVFVVPTEPASEKQSPEVQVKGQATVFVAFQNVAMPREPVDRTLEQIVKCVADIIPRFDALV
jgi:hypothetical protein